MTAAKGAGLSENLRGAGFICLSMFGFAMNDALMKLMAPGLGLFQAVFVRGVFASLFVLALAWRFGALRRLPPARDLPMIAVRIAAEMGATFCYLTALFHLPIANVSAIAQTMPLMITFAGAALLGERVGWRRWSAVAVGFVGVLIIVRPAAEGFDWHAVYALLGVICFTIRDLSTRGLSDETPSILVTLITSVGVMTLGGVGTAVGGAWTPVEATTLAGLACAALALPVGYYFGVAAMRSGDIGFVSPFRYTILIWAILLGMVVFGDVPDVPMLAGATLIVAAGLYTFWREQHVAARARRL